MNQRTPILETKNLTHVFGAVLALDNVNISFLPGEVHAIIGENGAGKSTLMRILSGNLRPTKGEIWLKTETENLPCNFKNVKDGQKAGIQMIHQELQLVDTLTVAENICLGKEPHVFGFLNRKAMQMTSSNALKKIGASIKPNTYVSTLSLAHKQQVEIAKSISRKAKILIMDEPTAVLTESESRTLFELIADLKNNHVTVIFISHRLQEVIQISDRVSVLRDGKLIGTFHTKETSPQDLAKHMIGRPIDDLFPPKPQQTNLSPILKIESLTSHSAFYDVSFDLRPGEILGFAGLIGSGRTQIAESLIGVRPITSGYIKLNDKPFRPSHPQKAADNGIVYVPEDRKEKGLFLSLNMKSNITMPTLKKWKGLFINEKIERQVSENWKRQLNIKIRNLSDPVSTLSGGNQQKISIAKWLESNPKILILDEPTRGIDIAAKHELYELILQLAHKGLACILISSELTEIIGLCNRVLVMREGRIAGELKDKQIAEESIMMLAAGVNQPSS